MVNPEELLADIRFRHYESIGVPPRRIYANGGFRGLFQEHLFSTQPYMMNYGSAWVAEDLEGADFKYMDMLVYCTLKTKNTTLLAVAK